MQSYKLTEKDIEKYAGQLILEDRAGATIEKYLRSIRAFTAWLGGKSVTRRAVNTWKEQLTARYAASTVNCALSALNGLFRFLGWDDCRVRFLRVQRSLFRDSRRELTKEDYLRLINTAVSRGDETLALLMETICACGIRVSEVRFITVAAARSGTAQVNLKGKIRTIMLPRKLCRKLLSYCRAKNILSGEIFLTGRGKSLSRQQIWRSMKRLARRCGVSSGKVFPHNLRHLFAVTYYRAHRDIVKLADILGHSSVETTRIYLVSSGSEHRRQIAGLGLIS